MAAFTASSTELTSNINSSDAFGQKRPAEKQTTLVGSINISTLGFDKDCEVQYSDRYYKEPRAL